MPAFLPRAFVDTILQAIEDSGYACVFVSRRIREHPRKFAVTTPEGDQILLWVYVWTLTFGGRPSLPNEYRIQMTTVSSPLPLNPKGFTMLLGYEPNLKM